MSDKASNAKDKVEEGSTGNADASNSQAPATGDEDGAGGGEAGALAMDKLQQLMARALNLGAGKPAEVEQVLDEVSFEGVAGFIKSGKCKNIVTMVGAGISTSAGIPDFRSPGTGLYHNLQQYDLPHPQAIFMIDFFKANPKPFFVLAKELYPGSFKPTICHYFIRMLHEKGLLRRHYTQDIVFFGESLPQRFAECASEDLKKCDLLIVMGTSLVVQPFASLASRVPVSTPRLYINLEKTTSEDDLLALLMGGTGRGFRFDAEDNVRDVFKQATCDEGCSLLADQLGWGEELQKLVKSEHERIDKENSSKGEAPTSAADASSTDNSASSAGDGTSPASKSPEQKL